MPLKNLPIISKQTCEKEEKTTKEDEGILEIPEETHEATEENDIEFESPCVLKEETADEDKNTSEITDETHVISEDTSKEVEEEDSSKPKTSKLGAIRSYIMNP